MESDVELNVLDQRKGIIFMDAAEIGDVVNVAGGEARHVTAFSKY
jgi:hypothetical protein